VSEFYTIHQAVYDNHKPPPPAYIYRATDSPNFGVREFEQVAKCATRSEAEAWVKEHEKK
jgi:hypothetical protein